MSHILTIPVNGPVAVRHVADDTDTRALLESFGGEGAYATLFLGEIKMDFQIDDTEPENVHARDAFVALGGPHVVMCGTVVFSGLSEEQMVTAIKAVG